MAVVTYPSWAYSATQPAQIVASAIAFAALGAGWSYTPFPPPGSTVPFDPGLPDTDTRLQQLLIEARVTNLLLGQEFNTKDDLQTVLRPDVLANDSSLTS